jgi:crotonobetainyl-CoA:carnitine CoA-transferase CaiB-like acyl-CoA transferase
LGPMAALLEEARPALSSAVSVGEWAQNLRVALVPQTGEAGRATFWGIQMHLAHLSSVVENLGLPRPGQAICLEESADVFGSPFAVTRAATASIGAALWAVSHLDAVRSGGSRQSVKLSGRHASAAFHSERLLSVPALRNEELWDPIAGNYPAADGWVRLHTNLPTHRRSALAVLDVPADRAAVAAAVAAWGAVELETAVAEAGGVAAAMRTRSEWALHPQAKAVASLPLVGIAPTGDGPGPCSGRFLDGIRVLDLTRVIAGPVAGRFLASFGADVLRVDAPLDDGLLVEIDTGFGKRRTSVNLRSAAGREELRALVAGADVVLEAFRPGALAGLGFDAKTLVQIRPGLVTGHLSAFGEDGPWGTRRGFDSITQVACGLAHACGFSEAEGPAALPAQALDHATGYLLAAGVLSGLTRLTQSGHGSRVTTSLVRTAAWLESLGSQPGRSASSIDPATVNDLMETRADTAWGEVRHLRAVGQVGDRRGAWSRPPVPRDEHRPSW